MIDFEPWRHKEEHKEKEKSDLIASHLMAIRMLTRGCFLVDCTCFCVALYGTRFGFSAESVSSFATQFDEESENEGLGEALVLVVWYYLN